MISSRRPSTIKVLLPLAVVFVVILAALPSSEKFSYEYRKGSPWKYETLVAQFDFPILKTAEQIFEEEQENKDSRIPYYRYSQKIVDDCLKQLSSLSLGEYEYLVPEIVSSVKNIYQVGVITDEGVKQEDNDNDSSSEKMVYIQKQKRVALYPASELYRLQAARNKLLSDLQATASQAVLDSLLNASGVYNQLVPNLIYDEQSTLLSSSIQEVSPTMGYVKAGKQIVSKDELVTAEIAQMLDSYKQEYDSQAGYSRNLFLFYLANVLIALTLVLLLFFAIYFSGKKTLLEYNKYLYILLVFVMFSVTALMIIRFGQESSLFLVPFTLAAILLNSFFDTKISAAVYSVLLLPMLIFAHSGLALYVIFLTGGLVSIYAFRYLNKGWRQFALALVVFVAMAAVYAGFRLLDMVSGNSYISVLYLLISSALVICGYPLLYLFERFFSLVSNSRLSELADNSNSLLRLLEQKAPGTFQHSLQVANMADYIGRLVGANSLLLRAGALYHDIGKMNNPQCFVENQTIHTYHSALTPQQSAHDIVRHVTDGVELAEKNHIPEVIRDFILTHHGTSRVGYFYTQYVNAGGNPDEDSDFKYSGKRPRTREQVILMLCDTVEAASRTLKEHTPEEYNVFIDRIVEAKVSESQLDKSEISIRELGVVKDGLKKYLSQLFHERITYPKTKQINNNIIKWKLQRKN